MGRLLKLTLFNTAGSEAASITAQAQIVKSRKMEMDDYGFWPNLISIQVIQPLWITVLPFGEIFLMLQL
jgi:hypothetical protein